MEFARLNESSDIDEPDDFDEDINEHAQVIRENRRLMEMQQRPEYKDRVLENMENRYDFRETKQGWRERNRQEQIMDEAKENVETSLIDILTKEEPEKRFGIEDFSGQVKTRGERLAELQAAFLEREQKRIDEET